MQLGTQGGRHKNALFKGRGTLVAMVTTAACSRFEPHFHTIFATFLYENEASSLDQAAVVTMATRVL